MTLLPEHFESAGKLPPFTSFGVDVEQPGALAKAASEIAYKKEIFLVCGDGSAYASPTALNTVLQLYALRIRHVLYISDGPIACARLRKAVPSLACAWSSIISTSKPNHDSVLVKKWWDMRFYFYNVRKHMLSRLSGELGYNVMQSDTDVAWFANPYPALKEGDIGEHQLVIQPDLPLANAGVLYAQRIARGDPTSWVLREVIDRIRAFSFHPEYVPRVLPWAQPPYFSNADEQSLLNDVLASAISQFPCFIFSTAIMEVKYGGTKKNRTFRLDRTAEGVAKPKMMAVVRARNERRDHVAKSCCHPHGLRVCTLPRRGNLTSFAYHLNSWRLQRPPPTADIAHFIPPQPPTSGRRLFEPAWKRIPAHNPAATPTSPTTSPSIAAPQPAAASRVAVVPEVVCETVVQQSATGPLGNLHAWKETRRRRQERRCAWLPPKPCWQVEYMTTLELQRQAIVEPATAVKLRALRVRANRTAAGEPGTTKREKRAEASRACAAGAGIGQVLTIRDAAGEAPATARSTERLEERTLTRLRALPCEGGTLAAIEDHVTEERLRRRRLRPKPSVLLTNPPPEPIPPNWPKGRKPPPEKVRSWGIVDQAAVAKALATTGAPRMAKWLLRDAKCIDQLLYGGATVAKPAPKRKAA